MAENDKKPAPCLHCAIVEAINAHAKAYPEDCHCSTCVFHTLTQCLGDVLAASATDATPSTATH